MAQDKKYLDYTGLKEFANGMKSYLEGKDSSLESAMTIALGKKLNNTAPSTSDSGNVVTGITVSGNDIKYSKAYVYNDMETTGSGNAVTSVSASNGKVTLTKGTTFAVPSDIKNTEITIKKNASTSDSFTLNTDTSKTIDLALGAAADKGVVTSISSTTGSDLPTEGAVVNYVNTKFADVADALVYKGTVSKASDIPSTIEKGWTYKVAVAGTYVGKVCEIGDMLIANKDATTATNDDFDVIQGNIDGAVIGPASATAEHVALFDGATGKLIKDGGALGTLAFSSTVSNGDATLAWGTKSIVATVGTTAITVSLPSNPDTTYTLSAGTTNGYVVLTPSTGTEQSVKVKGLEALAYKSSITSSEVTDFDTAVKAIKVNNATEADKVTNSLTIKAGSATVGTFNGENTKTVTFNAGTTAGTVTLTDGTSTASIQLIGEFTDTTYSAFTTSANGLVPQGKEGNYPLLSNGAWSTTALGSASFVDTTSTPASGDAKALTAGGAYSNYITNIEASSTTAGALVFTKAGSTTSVTLIEAIAIGSTESTSGDGTIHGLLKEVGLEA